MTTTQEYINKLRGQYNRGRGRGIQAHGHKIHNLNVRVKYLEKLVLALSVPWYTRLWRRLFARRKKKTT